MLSLESIWTVVWKSLAFLIVWAIPLALFIVPFQARLKKAEATNPPLAKLYLEFTSAIAVIFSAFVLVSFVDQRSFSSLGFDLQNIVQDIILGITLGLLWLSISLGVLVLKGWALPQRSNPIAYPLLMMGSVALFVNVVTQEILVRSYIFQTIQSQFGLIVAVIVSSLFFAALHAGAIKDSRLAALNVFGAGVLFGIAYALSGNLWLPIAIHSAWNVMLGPVLGLSISGQNPLRVNWQRFTIQGPALFTGGKFGLEASIVVTATTALAIISLIGLSGLPR